MIYVILGGSCSGKTEFALKCQEMGIPKVITNTTRMRRIDDFENSYHFLTKNEFYAKIESNEMIEYAEYNTNLYGVSVDSLSENCVVVLEPNGLRALKAKFPEKVFSILLDVSEEERLHRSNSRGDNIETITKRIEEDKTLFTEQLKTEVNMVVKDLKREEMKSFISKYFKI